MPKSVSISEMEYNSLKAAAELLAHPDVIIRTLDAVGRQRGVSLEDGFDSKADKKEQHLLSPSETSMRTKRRA